VLRFNRHARRYVLSIYWFARKTFRLATVRALWHSRLVPIKYWELIADKLSKADWTWGCVATVDAHG
jgi:hypothetical protein